MARNEAPLSAVGIGNANPYATKLTQPAQLYLKPGAKERGKVEVLKIVDFLDWAVSKEEDKMLIDSQGTKLYLKSSKKKPTLESVTLSQWVVGSLRIMNQMIEGNKFTNLGKI